MAIFRECGSELFNDQQSYDAIPIGLCVIGTDMRFLRINQTLARMNGASVEDHLGRSVAEVVPALELPAQQLMHELIGTGSAVGPFEIIGETPAHPGATRYWTEVWSPLFDEAGDIVAASVAVLDVTDRKLLEFEKEKALQAAERRLLQQTAIAELSQLALGTRDLQVVLDRAVTLAAKHLRVSLTTILSFQESGEQLKLVAGIGWAPGVVGTALVGTETQSQAGYTLDVGKLIVVEDLKSETRFSGSQLLHHHGVISGMSVPIEGTNGRPYGVFGIHSQAKQTYDLADQNFLIALAAIVSNAVRNHSSRAQRTLLIREMAHRAGNMLQLVSSIASQTFQGTADVAQARIAFSERLAALARANHVIAQEGWSDTRFSRVVSETLAPFMSQIDTEGHDILLAAELSFDLGLVLNELATNSCKYGSLGIDTGRVKLRWQLAIQRSESVFSLQWEDACAADRDPGTRSTGGFGSRMMKLLVESKWRGRIDMPASDRYQIVFTIPIPGKPAATVSTVT